MPFNIALQMDALARLDMTWDSTLELARVAAGMGHRLFHYEPQAMRCEVIEGVTRISAQGYELIRTNDTREGWQYGAPGLVNLADFDVVLMRQDPPFNMAYITATHWLDMLPKKTRVINDPSGVRNAPEKILNMHFPHLMTPTLISRDRRAIQDFYYQHKDIIIKPLYGHGSHGVFHLREGDDNLPALVETLSAANPEPWIVQKYLPVHQVGDKRIILLDGEVVGGVRRMPPANDIRGSLGMGARAERMTLTARDHEICEALGPTLRQRGLFLAGIDVIGNYLTEINVTSPSSLVDSDQVEGRSGKDCIAEQFWRKVMSAQMVAV